MNTRNEQPVFSIKQILFVVMLMAITISACSISSLTTPAVSTAATPDADTQATSRAVTVEAAVAATTAVDVEETAVSSTPNATTAANATVAATPPPPPARPTRNSANGASPTPTKQSASNGQAAADTVAPVFSKVGSSDSSVYYNDSSCGKTAVTILATVTDNIGVDQVWVNYLFAGNNGGGNWNQMNLTAVGNNTYEATINIAQAVGNDLQGGDGVMQYQVFAEDAAGNADSMPVGHPYGVEVFSCGVVGAPPQQPSGISIGNIQRTPDVATIYYGQCNNNEPTTLNLQTTIEPFAQIASAKIYYTYSNAMGMSPTYSVDMSLSGFVDYAGSIDTAWEAADTLGTENGNIDFYIQVEDVNGGTTDTPLIGLSMAHCGNAPLPPAMQMPTVDYFDGSATVAPGETVFIEWNVWDACRVFLDGNDVNAFDNFAYSIPSNESDRTFDHVLTAWGSSCDSSTQVEAFVTIQVQTNGGNNGNNGNGGGTVAFINNSSQPIISLIIDGAEMYPSDPMGILPGSTENFTVSDGAHSFTATNGWWNGGIRNEMYTFSGTFTAQDGDVTFNDPTIAELLTDWGNSRYFKSWYMDDNGGWHDIGFCFYANGSFVEYDNGAMVDSGSYTDVGHDSQLVSTRLTGQSVSVDALYYKAFGSLDVPRGNVVDEYVADSTVSCP